MSLAAAPGERLQLRLEYRPDLFDRPTVEALGERLIRLLEAAVADPDRAIGSLDILSADERHTILESWNDTARPIAPATVPELFAAQAARTPDAVAVVFGEQTLSYGELNARANQLAHHLHSLGVGPEVMVGLCVERSLEMVVGLLGILKAGGAYLPLDPDYPAERLAFMLEDAGAAVLLSHSRDWRPAVAACRVRSCNWIARSADTSRTSRRRAPRSRSAAPSNAAYVIYTSGSTGSQRASSTPTAACTIDWAGCRTTYRPERRRDAVLQNTPFSFDVSIWEFFRPLLTGAALILAAPGAHRDRRN